MKLLQIQFTKFYHCLVGQVWNQEGTFRTSEHVKASNAYFQLCDNHIVLPIDSQKIYPDFIFHETDEKVDIYLEKIIKWISEEQFGAGSSKLKIGEMCEVSDDGVSWHKYRLLAILPDRYEMRFIIENGTLSWCSCKYARPIVKRTEPKIDGDIYTWKIE